MKVKRLLAMILALAILMNLFVGCDIKIPNTQTPTGETSEEVSNEVTEEPREEVSKEVTKEYFYPAPYDPVPDPEPEIASVPVSITDDNINFVKGIKVVEGTLSGKKIQFYAAETWGHPSENKKILYQYLRENFGMTINVKPSVYTRDILQNVQEIKAGRQIDLIGVSYDKFPTVYSIMQPLNDKINLKYAPRGLDKSLMKATMKGKDIMYLPQYGSEGIAYNVDKFKKAGLEEPYDLQLKGQWTWDKFSEYAKFFTEDTDNDGRLEKWGFGSWDRTFHEFALTNNSGYYTYNADGTVTSNITDKAVVQSINYVKNLYSKDKSIYLFRAGTYPEFYSDESVAMMKMDIPHNPKELVYGMVAMPKGPNKGSENILTTTAVGYGLPATMNVESNEKAALLFLSIMMDFNEDVNQRKLEMAYGNNPRWKEMYENVYGDDAVVKPLILHGVGGIESKIGIIEEVIKREGWTVEEAVQILESKFEEQAKNAYVVPGSKTTT